MDNAAELISAVPDEQEVSQQLRLLMSPRGTKQGRTQGATSVAAEAQDPQLVYRPPAKIESHTPKAADAPVSAASFNKSESPLQAVVAVVGSMAILAVMYHFGRWEGSQVRLDSPSQASVGAAPMTSAAPEPPPLQYQPAPLSETLPAEAEPVPENIPEAPVEAPAPKPTPVVSVTPAQSPKGLYLQVAALKDSEAARSLESRLRTAGFSTKVLDDSEDGLIRIISGPYDEMTAARGIAREMGGLGLKPFPRRF